MATEEQDDDIQAYVQPWKPLNWGEMPEDAQNNIDFMQGARWAEKQLREKNA
jgi:hypothetical protein